MMMKCIRGSLLLFNGERVIEGQTFDAPEPYASDYINGRIAVQVAEPVPAKEQVPPVYPEDHVATQTEPARANDPVPPVYPEDSVATQTEPARANDPVPPVYPEDSVATQTEPETPDDAAGSPKVGKKKGR